MKRIAYILPLSLLAGIILGGLIINNRGEKRQNVIVDSGEYSDKAWLIGNSDAIHSIDHICVSDSSTAIEISNLIFQTYKRMDCSKIMWCNLHFLMSRTRFGF